MKVEWVTTEPNPRSPATGVDAGQRGGEVSFAPMRRRGEYYANVWQMNS